MIYSIRENDSKNVYIGYSENPKRRFKEHLGEANRGKRTKKCDWLRKCPDDKIQLNIIISGFLKEEIEVMYYYICKEHNFMNSPNDPEFYQACKKYMIENLGLTVAEIKLFEKLKKLYKFDLTINTATKLKDFFNSFGSPSAHQPSAMAD